MSVHRPEVTYSQGLEQGAVLDKKTFSRLNRALDGIPQGSRSQGHPCFQFQFVVVGRGGDLKK